jgi:hypothetical protein
MSFSIASHNVASERRSCERNSGLLEFFLLV